MKVFFVGNTSWSMWNFRRDVMKSLKEKGHDIVVAAPPDSYSLTIAKHFRFVPLKRLDRKGMSPLQDALLFLELLRLYIKERPDAAFHYTIKPNVYGSVAAWVAGTRAISMVAGAGYSFSSSGLLRHIAANLYRISYKCSEKTIFLNEEDLQDFKDLRIIDEDASKAVVFQGEGIDTEHFAPPPQRSTATKFFFVGRLLMDKGLMEFCRAAELVKKTHPEVQFCVLGPLDKGNPHGISEEALFYYVKAGAIEYLGVTDDVRPYIAKATALILPTYYGEGLSRVVLEAMSMGTPVISTANRGVAPLVVDGETGFICKQQDHRSLADAIFKYLALPDAAKVEFSLNARKKVCATFDMNKIKALYFQLLNHQ